jgi:hypothetical protein
MKEALYVASLCNQLSDITNDEGHGSPNLGLGEGFTVFQCLKEA